MSDEPIIRRVVIRGRVQGVGFRMWVEHEAQARGLAGWVRNRRDGTVEAVFAGSPATVAAIMQACRRGPRLAHVETVDAQEAGTGELAARRPGEIFSQLPTV